MVLSLNYELVEVADEFLAVPVGEMANRCKDVFVFSKAAGYLLGLLKMPLTKAQLIQAVMTEYELDYETASHDVEKFVTEVSSYGIVSD